VQALAAAGDMLFSAGQDASLRVWKLDAASGQWGCVAVLKVEQGGHRAPISCLWASHPFLFSADYLGTLKVRQTAGLPAGKGLARAPECSAPQRALEWELGGRPTTDRRP
jgi:hypothetical protein